MLERDKMDCGLKRKWDGINAEMLSTQAMNEVSLHDQKRVRLSIQLGSAVPHSDCTSFASETPTEAWSWMERATTVPSDMDMEDKEILEDSDIPSTAEVINSLRKVILWMSAQDDHNNDYIQYLTDVEHYALSKQPNQQRKITQYLIRQND